jgi:hypothetical protein
MRRQRRGQIADESLTVKGKQIVRRQASIHLQKEEPGASRIDLAKGVGHCVSVDGDRCDAGALAGDAE